MPFNSSQLASEKNEAIVKKAIINSVSDKITQSVIIYIILTWQEGYNNVLHFLVCLKTAICVSWECHQ